MEHLHEDGNETTSERSMVVSDSTKNLQALKANLQDLLPAPQTKDKRRDAASRRRSNRTCD
jgi:hypothetical protein